MNLKKSFYWNILYDPTIVSTIPENNNKKPSIQTTIDGLLYFDIYILNILFPIKAPNADATIT